MRGSPFPTIVLFLWHIRGAVTMRCQQWPSPDTSISTYTYIAGHLRQRRCNAFQRAQASGAPHSPRSHGVGKAVDSWVYFRKCTSPSTCVTDDTACFVWMSYCTPEFRGSGKALWTD
ncbi:hypothetical protein MRX96_045026 [Rhipicephalus microplus]